MLRFATVSKIFKPRWHDQYVVQHHYIVATLVPRTRRRSRLLLGQSSYINDSLMKLSINVTKHRQTMNTGCINCRSITFR